jgi:hypothetical protein
MDFPLCCLLALEPQVFPFGKLPHEKSENEKAGNKFYPVEKERPGKYIAKNIAERKIAIEGQLESFYSYWKNRTPYERGKKQVTPFSFAAFCFPFINIFFFAG